MQDNAAEGAWLRLGQPSGSAVPVGMASDYFDR